MDSTELLWPTVIGLFSVNVRVDEVMHVMDEVHSSWRQGRVLMKIW